jgi:hypothetical protein
MKKNSYIRTMKIKHIQFERFNQWGQMYPLPTIRVTHTLKLYGWYTIEFIWFNRGLSINIFV